MNIWTELGRAKTASGDTIILRQRGELFDIRFNGWELMSNRNVASETALAQMVCRRIDRAAPKILIGGLGMGYTLRAALDAVGAGATVIVCELLKEIVAWNEGVLSSLAGHPLGDERVTVLTKNVVDVIEQSGPFDAIMLDTDNGPDCVVHEPNQILYTKAGLLRISRALRDSAIVGIWSATKSQKFEDLLDSLDWDWQQIQISLGTPGEEPFHIIYLADPSARAKT